MFVLHPKYEYLRHWVEDIPIRFEQIGKVIYNARNQIRLMSLDNDLDVCIKRFRKPFFINRYIYRYIKDSKAKRSYYNALYLLSHNVNTPYPIAFIEQHKFGGLDFSYLITKRSSLCHLNREFTLAFSLELDETIRPLAQFIAHMHNEHILHLDLSPGNILWDKIGDKYKFEVIDLNRMKFKDVGLKLGCWSIRRLCARSYFFDIFADEYAKVRNFDPTQCKYWIHYYRNQFWKNGKKVNYQYD